ncbi:GIY-YIG nuclease family protein [Patescibacteria group bacterium]|nr:GIY-YIG nuclease family protein [Patescibacteria group bacterium]MBU4265518.1 GIY-YIG nuclease family protein [Patescibacteria group bacterium]MBU4390569.1 GIY-YIG nuclease family protein [Patescibacteria group bacterium]
MAFVYIIKNKKNDCFYLGCSNNPELRLKTYHNAGRVKATKGYIPWRLVFKQKCKSATQARQIEYKLKSMKSKRILKQIVDEQNCRLIND